MKKLLLITTLIFGLYGVIYAQDLGKFWLGGNFGVVNSDIEHEFYGNEKQNTYSFAPEIGIVLSPKVSLGLNLSCSYAKNENDYSRFLDPGYYIYNEDVRRTNLLSATLFARYNVFETGKLRFFVDGGIAYGGGSQKSDNIEVHIYSDPTQNNKYYESVYDENVNYFEVGLKPGLALRATDKIEFVTRIGFLGYEYSKEATGREKKWDFRGNMSNISIGVNYYLN